MIAWIQENWKDIMAALGCLVTFITAVVKLTATEKDDTIWAKVLKVLAALSLVNPDGSVIGKKDETEDK